MLFHQMMSLILSHIVNEIANKNESRVIIKSKSVHIAFSSA